jgi:hypothetical protein
MDEREFVIPSYDDLDPEKIDVFFDVDLDELTILFFGREREHYVHPMNAVLSYLLDMETDEVVGISLNRFMRQVVSELPDSRVFLEDAAIITGDHLIPPMHHLPAPPSLGGRLMAAFLGARAGWREERVHERQRTLKSLPLLS